MLPPPPKSKAASIWSFDSGYGSNTLEDEEGFPVDYSGSSSAYQTLSTITQEPLGSALGGPWDIQIEEQLRLRRPESPIQALTAKLNVFTTNAGSNADFQFSASSNNQDECVTCQLWQITNSGEHLKCDECSGKASSAPDNVHPLDEQPKAKNLIPHQDFSNDRHSEYPRERKVEGRCSACEISALIDPTHPAACTSCTAGTCFLSPLSPSQTSKVKRSSARRPPTKLESHALRILQGWLRENQSNPYPDADTKRSLAERCGITEKQVNTWFTNARARRRLVNPADQSNPVSEDEGSRRSRLSSVASAPVFDYSTASSYPTPFDRRDSDAPHSISNGFTQTSTIGSRRGKKKDYGQIALLPLGTPQTAFMPPAPQPETITSKKNEIEMWQCTFCYQQVARKSWRRHEETQHRPKWKWTCLHTGPTLTLPPSRSNTSAACVFCMVPNPSKEHLERSHRITECSQKSEDDRTFLRPDHLRQHVKNFHKSSLEDSVRDAWRREGPGKDVPENWTCSFCAQELRTWDARETHIANHFKNGLTMSDWNGNVQPDEPSKKRPTSSEGRPNVFAKLARTFTSRSMRQPSSYDFSDPMSTSTDAIGSSVPVLPDLVFDSFMAEVSGNTFEFDDPNPTVFNELNPTAEAQCDSAFPWDEALDFDFDALAGGFLHEDIPDLTGLWHQ